MPKFVHSLFSRQYLPDTLAGAGFLCAAILLFSNLIIPLDTLIYRGDMPSYYAREFATRYAISEGVFPLWNMFMATSLVADPQSGIFYPGMVLFRWLPQPYMFIWTYLVHAWLAGLGMYVLARDLGTRRSAAILGGFAYMLSGVMIARMIAGHVTIVHAIPWVPWLFLFYRRLLVTERVRYFFATLFCTVSFSLTGHPEIILFGLLPTIALGLLMMAEAAVRKQFALLGRLAGFSIGIALLSTGMLAVYYLPVGELVSLTSRAVNGMSLGTSTTGIMQPQQTAVLTLPLVYFSVFDITSTAVFDFIGYTGVITIGLALLGLFPADRNQRKFSWLLAGVAIFALLVAQGPNTPGYTLIFQYARLMRNPARILLLWAFASAALAALGLDAFLRRWEAGMRPGTGWLWLSIVYTLAGLVWLVGVYLNTISGDTAAPGPDILSAAVGLLMAWPAVWLAVAVMALWAAILIARRWIPARIWQWVAVAGILIDVGSAARLVAVMEYEPTNYTAIYFDSANPYLALDADPGEVRMWGLSFSEPTTLGPSFGIPVIVRDLQGSPHYLVSVARIKDRGNLISASGYAILVAPGRPEKYDIVKQVGNMILLHIPGDLPRVYATGAAIPVKTLETGLDMLSAPEFDPLAQTIVYDPDGSFAGLPEDGDTAAYEAGFTVYAANHVVVHSSSASPMMLVIAEPYFPGWVATIDGQPARIWQVNNAFRGVLMQPGEHTIEMTYQPESFRTGALISMATLILTAGGALWLAVRQIRKASPSAETH